MIKEYGEGRDIVSVHFLKFPWDGNEWEYFLLGYMGEDKHRHFVIVEEIFYDRPRKNYYSSISLTGQKLTISHTQVSIEFYQQNADS